MKPVVKCDLMKLEDVGTFFRAHLKLYEDKLPHFKANDVIVTSRIRTIDFDNHLIVTQNSVYQYHG